tara:strand:- start:677 stop:1246 length:570 start_codon:yes stop_codon:yes gene_type:complete
MELRIVLEKSSNISLDEFKRMREEWREQIALAEIQQISHWKSIDRLELAYEKAALNKYVVMTLRDKKMRYMFPKASNVVLIGSGMYPYSLFDLHKQYPHIKSVGVEIDKKRALVSRVLVEKSPAKDMITIENCNGLNYDFSWLGIDDLVFVSVDVEIEKKIQKKVILESKASPFLCAPYHTAWRDAYLS